MKTKRPGIPRRQFLLQTTSLAMASACTAPKNGVKCSAPRLDEAALAFARNVEIDPGLQGSMRTLVEWARDNGWLDLLAVHVRDDVADTDLREILLDERTFAGDWCKEFGAFPKDPGQASCVGRLIYPGRPEFSALYHVLASQGVAPAHPAPNASERYPLLCQLDTLENFIYALAPWPNLDKCCVAVFAYQYAPALATPHRQHADLLFSRTGIARIGQHPPNYDALRRRHVNLPETGSDREFAVTPARYGVFVAEKLCSDRCSYLGPVERDDDRRIFVRPLRKLFSEDLLLASAKLTFAEQHRNEALRRIALHNSRELKVEPAPPDLSLPPFLCISNTVDGKPDGCHNTDLVVTESVGASVLVSSAPAEMVRVAQQRGQTVTIGVPPDGCSNRRYSTLKLLEDGAKDSVDAAFENLYEHVQANRFSAPRNAPLFVNVRFEVTAQRLQHIDGRSYPRTFEHKIDGGDYRAALFEDSICDGCVSATLSVPSGEPAAPLVRTLLNLEWMPAFSLVTAPDFFPEFAGFDLEAIGTKGAQEHFYAGGTAPLSFTRIRANPAIKVPRTGRVAFPTDAARHQMEDTVTAVVCRRDACDAGPSSCESVSRTGFLPDGASAVLFPGWDVTYVGAGDDDPLLPAKSRFLATYGLGSPFPEDIKLCAAANGMWPGSSPDAVRTFQGSLRRPSVSTDPSRCDAACFTRVGGTSIPLLDSEIGIHPSSPAVVQAGVAPHRGWDGEYGPYLEWLDGLFINYAQIDRVDYVLNSVEGLFDASKLRKITLTAALSRMRALRRCVQLLDRGKSPRQTSLWLIVAEAVDDYAADRRGDRRGLALPPPVPRRELVAAPSDIHLRGPGFFFVFGRHEPRDGDNAREGAGEWVRSRIVCDQVAVCHVALGSTGGLAASRWHPAKPHEPLEWIYEPGL